MSIAYPVSMVEVESSVNMNGHGLGVGSRWVSGNLVFQAEVDGRTIRDSIEQWALARDPAGKLFIIWLAPHRNKSILVIQRADSRYCYEVVPLEV